MCANLNMANVWILLAVTMLIPLISATICSDIDNIMNCNECFRCGGYWCKDPEEEGHCFQSIHDSWCHSSYSEIASTPEEVREPGKVLNPKYIETTVYVNRNNAVQISYNGTSSRLVKSTIVNTTQNNDLEVTEYTHCRNGTCTTVIESSPKFSFCSTTGRTSESLILKVSFAGLSEESTVKYNVPCACACSDIVEKGAGVCHEHGDFSCGVCTCYSGWTGKYCDKPICGAKRGDVLCNNPNNNLECSGNGVCGPCESCICYTDRVGSIYFDKNNYCADICMTVNECDECLQNPSPGKCRGCPFPLFYQNFNETLLTERDDLNRSIWIWCNETLADGYHVEYVAMRDVRYDTYYMIPPSNTTNAAVGGGGTNVTLPIVLPLLAVLAAAGAFVAYKFWKGRTPPLPLTDPMYTNIDAEDCTGENPLYKPPTSSFKNPTYGKW